MSEVASPTATFGFVEDVDSRGYNIGTWVLLWNLGTAKNGHPQSFNWNDPLPMYHGNVSTFSFLDGHAVHHKWVDAAITSYGKTTAAGNTAFTAPITNPGADYEYVYQGYRFPGWRE